MAHIFPRRAPYICKACRSSQTTRPLFRALSSSVGRATTLRQQLEGRNPDITTKKTSKLDKRIHDESKSTSVQAQQPKPPLQQTEGTESRNTQALPAEPRWQVPAHDIPDPSRTLRIIQEDALQILEADTIPEERQVAALLQRAQELASALVHMQPTVTQPGRDPATQLNQSQQRQTHQGPRSTLLVDLNEAQLKARREQEQRQQEQVTASTLSQTIRHNHALNLAKTLYTLLEDPKLFISESLLTTYTSTIATLSLPQYLPKIFHLYAHKPIPKPGSYPITYSEPDSRAPKYAIPLKVADMAIECAIRVRDMPLAITLIDTTVNTQQYKIAKFIRKAAIPLTAAASVVPLSYALSQRAAEWQLSWDPDMFFWMCMAGSTAYLGTMGTLLFITVTTWNDHHKRVRWVPGTPLTRRWFREEERYYLDRVAQGWGFKEEERWGEEGGEEWEGFREVCAGRWLEVDRSSLLPGML